MMSSKLRSGRIASKSPNKSTKSPNKSKKSASSRAKKRRPRSKKMIVKRPRSKKVIDRHIRDKDTRTRRTATVNKSKAAARRKSNAKRDLADDENNDGSDEDINYSWLPRTRSSKRKRTSSGPRKTRSSTRKRSATGSLRGGSTSPKRRRQSTGVVRERRAKRAIETRARRISIKNRREVSQSRAGSLRNENQSSTNDESKSDAGVQTDSMITDAIVIPSVDMIINATDPPTGSGRIRKRITFTSKTTVLDDVGGIDHEPVVQNKGDSWLRKHKYRGHEQQPNREQQRHTRDIEDVASIDSTPKDESLTV